MGKGFIYDSAFEDAFLGELDFKNDKFSILLLSSLYRPSRTRHSRRSDLIGEVEGAGYEQGGRSIGLSVQRIVAGKDKTNIDLIVDEAVWKKVSVTARYAVVYRNTGKGPAHDPLVACLNFVTDFISTAGPFTIPAATLRIENQEENP
jgi:hypothetical protein